MTSKLDTLRFESGKAGLPARLKAARLRQMVVGANGMGYDERLWPRSDTFRCGDQSNLIAHDKQSRHFEAADGKLKMWLKHIAYGGEAFS